LQLVLTNIGIIGIFKDHEKVQAIGSKKMFQKTRKKKSFAGIKKRRIKALR